MTVVSYTFRDFLFVFLGRFCFSDVLIFHSLSPAHSSLSFVSPKCFTFMKLIRWNKQSNWNGDGKKRNTEKKKTVGMRRPLNDEYASWASIDWHKWTRKTSKEKREEKKDLTSHAQEKVLFQTYFYMKKLKKIRGAVKVFFSIASNKFPRSQSSHLACKDFVPLAILRQFSLYLSLCFPLHLSISLVCFHVADIFWLVRKWKISA